MGDTIEALQRASGLPISIIIVGVGAHDFANMKILDDDNGQLTISRDVVQVPNGYAWN
jgi:hypothetical protein